jgi:diacylglycerol kinase (ATP)
MKIALIVNPHAGGEKSKQLLSLIEKKLSSHHIDCHTYISLYHEHIFKITRNLKIQEYDAIISLGGDGTNFQILNGLLSAFKSKELPPLGIIPIGSGNSFAKDLDILDYEDGIRSIVKNNPKWIDVCSFTQSQKKFYFVNLMGLGFVTDVAKTAQRFKFFKDFSYIIGVFYRTINLKFHHMELEVNNEKITGENCFVEFCNSRFTGGNMMMAPEAKIDDGIMDIIVAGKMSQTSLLATLPKIFKGTHINHPAVRSFKAKKARIKTWPDKTLLPDGEIFGTTPATIMVHPKMIRYLT